MDSLIGTVPDSWKKHRLSEVCDVLAGPSSALLSSVNSAPPDVPVVTPRDMRHNRVADTCAAGVPLAVARTLSRYRLRAEDIVCVRTGQLGRQALVGADQNGWLISSNCLRLRVRQTTSARYLVYYLGHPAVHDWIIRNADSSVVPTLSTKMLGALPVVIPTDDVQAAAVDVLSALDDKIIVHEQISRTAVALRAAVLVRLLAGTELNP